jgi:hypothetical protein
MATRARHLIDTRPTVRPDRAGYVLDGESIDGFADRRDVSKDVRVLIARMAARFAPDAMTDWQRSAVEVAGTPRASELLVALTADEEDVDLAFQEGLFDDVRPSDLKRARAQQYPIRIGQASKLTGATQRQLRHWEGLGLLRTHVINNQRLYFKGAVIRAFALVKHEQFVLSTLGKAKGGDAAELIRLLAAVLLDSDDRELSESAAGAFEAAAFALRSFAPELAGSVEPDPMLKAIVRFDSSARHWQVSAVSSGSCVASSKSSALEYARELVKARGGGLVDVFDKSGAVHRKHFALK